MKRIAKLNASPAAKPILLLLSFVGLTFFSRFLNLPVNFSPLLALALFAGAQWSLVGMGILLPLGLMVASDMFIGFHETMPYTYASVILITAIGFLIRQKRSVLLSCVLAPIASSVLFFFVTNFGVWQSSGLYSHDMKGFLLCFEMALPFLQNTVVSTIFFAMVFNGLWLVVRKRLALKHFDSNRPLERL